MVVSSSGYQTAMRDLTEVVLARLDEADAPFGGLPTLASRVWQAGHRQLFDRRHAGRRQLAPPTTVPPTTAPPTTVPGPSGTTP